MQVPLTVIERDGRYLLIAGRHRLEALRVIGEERVPVRVVDFDDIEARLWTISENLHRTELTVRERAEQIAEFAKLTKERMEAQKQARSIRGPRGPILSSSTSRWAGKCRRPSKREFLRKLHRK